MVEKLKRKTHGFTLLEMALVVGIIGLMLAAIVPAMTQEVLKKKELQLAAQVQEIERAIQGFVVANNRLPCPAVRGTAVTAAAFGTEAATPGTCTGTYAPAANVAFGTVPTRSLGISEEFAFDPWGRALTYVVDLRATGSAAFTTYPVDSAGLSAIQVNDDSGGARTPTGVLVLISHGPNGHGGYLRSGARYSVAVTNTDEQDNCKCQAVAASDQAAPNNQFWAQLPRSNAGRLLNSFDDRVFYYPRSNTVFVSSADLLPSTPAGGGTAGGSSCGPGRCALPAILPP